MALAYIHSPDMPLQLETLYLSAHGREHRTLSFRDAVLRRLRAELHRGRQSRQRHGKRHEHLTEGTNPLPGRRPCLATPAPNRFRCPTSRALQFEKHFATGGQLLVGFANSFVWQFAGPEYEHHQLAAELQLGAAAAATGGRAIALEQLTIVERQLLANLRAYAALSPRFLHADRDRRRQRRHRPAARRRFLRRHRLDRLQRAPAPAVSGGVGQVTNFGRAGFTAATNASGAVAAARGFAGGDAGAVRRLRRPAAAIAANPQHAGQPQLCRSARSACWKPTRKPA